MRKYRIFFETCENIKRKKINNVKIMITSPPYWDLKNYEAKNQIGYKESYETYLKRMNNVWTCIYKSLSKNGLAIININTKSFEKRLKLIPYDFIKQLSKIGFYFQDVHYWHKSSGIPAINNLKDNYEYFLFFSKSKKIEKYEKNIFFDYKVKQQTNNSNIWNINKKFGSIGKKFMVHPAIFPVEYIDRLLKIFSEKNDLVLDPFLGSGSTLISCMKLERKFIGFELNNKEYMRLIIQNLNSHKLNHNDVDFKFI
jgi:site-specific DNA-methyltransferase (adenine-specific)